MPTAAFDRCLNRLLGSARRYHDAPRDPERVEELATARWDLELARRDVAAVRSRPASAPIVRRRRESDEEEAARLRLRVRALGLTTN